MSQAQANAEVVAQHREEILFELFSRYILVIGGSEVIFQGVDDVRRMMMS